MLATFIEFPDQPRAELVAAAAVMGPAIGPDRGSSLAALRGAAIAPARYCVSHIVVHSVPHSVSPAIESGTRSMFRSGNA